MPTAGGLPGSRGVTQQWPYQQEEARPSTVSASWVSGGGFSSVQGVGKNFGEGQTVFRVWANSDAKTKAWSENGYERWKLEKPNRKDGARKVQENKTEPGDKKFPLKENWS